MKSGHAVRAGFHPFWFWNGNLDDDEMRRQIREMADKGIRGFFIHPRQGLRQPYLSNAFFNKVATALDEAGRLGLDVHLYDEYPYPSGTAGGMTVMGQPEFQAVRLIQNIYDSEGGLFRMTLPEGLVLEARAFPLIDGKPRWNEGIDLRDFAGSNLTRSSYIEGRSLSRYNYKRFWAGGPAPAIEAELPPGKWRIFASVQAEIREFKYWGKRIDVFNPQAVRRFLELTHERYARRFGKDFGGAIKSIFVDETTPEGWSRFIPSAFFDEYGYDINEHLHALQDREHPEHGRVRADLERLRYRLFCESWEVPYSQWCRKNGIAYAGEKEALRFEQMKYMDIPGCDPGHTKAGDWPDLLGGTPRRNARTTASAAWFYNKPGALCECFHSIGWSGTIQDIKIISEALLLCGIRYLVPHGFFYSSHGLRKHDAPPSVFFQMPYWPLFGRLAERIDRIAGHFEGTWIDPDILLIDPGEGMPDKEDIDACERIHNALMAGHMEYLACDSALLRGGRIEDGRVRIKDISARVVILPPMQIATPELEEWLSDFERAGGAVVRCSKDINAEGLLSEVDSLVSPSLNLKCDGDGEKLWIVRRSSRDRRLWFIVNTGDRAIRTEIQSDSPLREIALDECAKGPLLKSAGGWTREIAPFESLMLEEAGAEESAPPQPQVTVRISGEARVRPLDNNLLRLYDWRMSLLDARGEPIGSAPVRAMPLANQLKESGLRFAPEIRITMCGETRLSLPLMRVGYECSFNCLYGGDVLLVMEPDSIVGDWRIAVNDSAPFGPEAFAAADAHVRGSLAGDITSLLRPGANRLSVEVETDKPEGGLLNALYLAGAFGARCDPPSLAEPVEDGIFEDYEGNLLPYYSGSLEYDVNFIVDIVPEGWEGLVNLEFDTPFQEACEVSINGCPFQAAAWSPRRIIIPPDSLKTGQNSMTVRVFTSLIRSFEGKYFDPELRQARPVGTAS